MSDQIDVNALADALNEKMDLPDGKTQSDVDYVVERKSPTSSDQTWYRVYKSGWVEQGGTYTTTYDQTLGNTVITMPISFTDIYYSLVVSYQGYNGNNFENKVMAANKQSVNTFSVAVWGGSSSNTVIGWEAKGMGA